jgi:hypothetical protein
MLAFCKGRTSNLDHSCVVHNQLLSRQTFTMTCIKRPHWSHNDLEGRSCRIYQFDIIELVERKCKRLLAPLEGFKGSGIVFDKCLRIGFFFGYCVSAGERGKVRA